MQNRAEKDTQLYMETEGDDTVLTKKYLRTFFGTVEWMQNFRKMILFELERIWSLIVIPLCSNCKSTSS